MRGTTGWEDTGGEYANGGCFARSVGSEQAENFAAPHGKRDAIYGVDAGARVAFYQLSDIDRNGLFGVVCHKTFSLYMMGGMHLDV